MEKIKRKVFDLIRDDDQNSLSGNIFDGIIIVLIVLNTIFVIINTFTLPDWLSSVSRYFEIISVVIFTIEYLLRVWVSDYLYPGKNAIISRIRYIVSLMAIIDLLSILPFYMPFLIPVDLRILRILRIARLMRLFKVNRYTTALKTIGSVLKGKASQLLSSIIIILILMIFSSVIIYYVENPEQPEIFANALSGMWWSVVTMTTVGYGDIYPITAAGKLFSAIISILGIGLVAIPTGIISAGFVEKASGRTNVPVGTEATSQGKKQYCPYCGNHLDR